MGSTLYRIAAAGLAGAAAAVAGVAAPPVRPLAPRPPAFQRMIDCRPIADAAARVACYDAGVDAMDRAEQAGEVVIIDGADVRAARRSLFGFRLPELAVLGGNKARNSDEEEFRQIETTIKSVRMAADGWAFELEDGARWRQTDGQAIASAPRPGQKIRIRQAALGSFLANVNGQTAVRVRREN
ncbi:MAG: hypothetical protein JWL91_648 [Sphingomonas bacterium]|nr:hypothetical protein [Sphingomonas bacterium]MDB5688772.1 hypothetical protein [Sphingomonas bacterium]